MIAVTWAMAETVLLAISWTLLTIGTITVAAQRHRRRRRAAQDPLEHLRALQRLDARRAR